MVRSSLRLMVLALASVKLQVPVAGHTGSPFLAVNPEAVNVICSPTKKVSSAVPSMVSDFMVHGEATIKVVACSTAVGGVGADEWDPQFSSRPTQNKTRKLAQIFLIKPTG